MSTYLSFASPISFESSSTLPAVATNSPSTSQDTTPDSPGQPQPSPRSPPTRQRQGGLRAYLIPIVAVVVVVAVVGLVIGLYGGSLRGHLSSTGSGAVVLFPDDAWYSLPADQFADAAFTINSTHVVKGTFDVIYWMQSYLMTPAELEELAFKGTVQGYSWFGGNVANGSTNHFETNVTAGTWDLVFFNPSPYNTTAIGFLSDMTLAPT